MEGGEREHIRRGWREPQHRRGPSEQQQRWGYNTYESKTRKERSNKEFTVFVYNLPFNLDQFGLKGIFQRAGEVSDSYIPRRRPRKKTSRYGFVRFRSHNEARRSISMLDNALIRGKRILVSMAKYGKLGRAAGKENYGKYSGLKRHQKEQVWRRKDQINRSKVRINDIEAFKIIGEKNLVTEEWLQRSLVCESAEPRELNTLITALISNSGMSVHIRAISCFKFLITFPSTELMEECLSNHGELDLWFTDIAKWSIYDKSEARRVWVEIIGVPPHGWLEANFQKIAELWGRLICFGQSIDSTENFESMKLLLATDHLHRIEADLLLQIEDAGYRIVVLEAGPYVQFNQPCKEPTNEECPGLEDFHDNMATNTGRNINNSSKMLGGEEAVQESEDIQKNSKLDPSQGMNGEAEELAGIQNSNKAAQEMEGVQNYSNLEPIQGPPNGSLAGSNCSVSRTRTACFSCNVNSEECISIKKAQLTSAIKDQQVTAQACVKALNEEGDQGINEDSSPYGPPPGFECAIHSSGVVVDKNGITETSSYSSGSTDRQAREALQIGELVGLKIVQNKEEAVARIKRTLRSNSKRLQQSQEKFSKSKKTNKAG